MNKLLVILGPTATGKTDLGLELAKKYNGELVACDSRQVYKGLNIGTGKMPGRINCHQPKAGRPLDEVRHDVKKGVGYWEFNGIKVWLYDVISLDKQYTVADYVKDAERVINDIHSRGKLPIVVGGTGLYLKALLEGLPNLEIPVNEQLREELSTLSKEELQKKLQKLSPEKWNELNGSDKQNPRRLLRSIELVSMYGYMNKPQISNGKSQKYNILKIGLNAPREVLYKKVDLRVLDWIQEGIIDEVIELNNHGINLQRIKELGLEYRLIAEYLESSMIDQQPLVTKIQNKIHAYVRRQVIWFKNPATSSGYINWVDITDKDFPAHVEKLIQRWYYKPIK